MAGDVATAADLQKMSIAAGSPADQLVRNSMDYGVPSMPMGEGAVVNQADRILTSPMLSDPMVGSEGIASDALTALGTVGNIRLADQVNPPAMPEKETTVTAPSATMSLLDQPISQDPFENLSKNQRRMLAFAAIKDAGMALQGKEGEAFTGTLAGFRERADMERKRQAALAQRQMLQGVFGGVTPVTGDTTMTPDALRQRIAQLSQLAIANPTLAQGIAIETKRIEGEVERLTQAEKSLVAQGQGVAAVDALLNSPDLAKIAGFSGTVNQFFEKFGKAKEYSNLMSYVDQIKGLNFVEAYQQLKGGGPITDTEGRAATAARTRIDRALMGNVEDLKLALMDARKLFQDAMAQNPMYSGQMLGFSEEDMKYLQ
jgi:hypothetical protein